MNLLGSASGGPRPDRPGSARDGRTSVLLPLLLLILLGVLVGWAFFLAGLIEHERRGTAQEELTREAGRVAHALDPEVVVERAGRDLYRRLGRETDRAADRTIASFRRDWGEKADPCWFDREGRMVTPASVPLRSRFLAQKIWDMLTLPPDAGEQEERRYRKQLGTVFGPAFLIGALRDRPDRTQRFRARNREGFFWWRRAPGAGRQGLLCLFWSQPSSRPTLKRLVPALRTRRARLAVLSDSGRLATPGWRAPPSLLAALERAATGDEPLTWQTTVAIARVPHPSRRILLVKGFARVDLDPVRRGVGLVALAVGLLGGILLVRRPGGSPGLALSVVHQSMFIFGLAILLPLLGLAFLGFRTLQDRQEILRTHAISRFRALLTELDHEFTYDRNLFQIRCRRLRDAALAASAPAALQATVAAWNPEDRPSFWEVRTLPGDIWLRPPPAPWFRGLDSFLDAFGKFTIARHLQSRLNAERTAIHRPPDAMTQQLMATPQMGFAHVLNRADVVQFAVFGTSQMYWYWDVMPREGHPAAFLTVLHPLSTAWRQFLQRRLASPPPDADRPPRQLWATPTRPIDPADRTDPADPAPRHGDRPPEPVFLVKDSDSGAWYPSRPHLPEALEAMAARCLQERAPCVQETGWQGRPALVLALPGRNLTGHALLCLQPTDEIFRSLGPFRRALLLALVAALLVAGLFGKVLGDLFLDPVRELSGGLAALRRADNRVRIPAAREDEFGDLARAFNRMVEELSELELARVVQESLLPSAFPPVPGFRGSIWTRTASRLGGDYCDVFPLPDGRVLFVIGDVTGHGVGAALVMAMVKAEVFHFAEKPADRLEEILERLDRLLHDLMKRKLLMTFFAGMLTPPTGRITGVNAGHPFPLHLPTHGPAKDWQMPGMPLGFSLRPRAAVATELTLAPGESLVLFTDGLYEAMNQREEPLGYDGLTNALRNAGRLSAEGITALLRKTVDRFREDRELADDCTIMVLQRLPEGGSHG